MNGLSLSLPNILTIPKEAQLILFCFTFIKNVSLLKTVDPSMPLEAILTFFNHTVVSDFQFTIQVTMGPLFMVVTLLSC